jgi:aryl-alcohol dehydrogenase-like predicted oxidoreductase
MAISTAPFGRTGHDSTRVLFGGAALAGADQAEADAAFDVVMRFGINHIDVAADYGEAELRIKPWLQRVPGHFFLATKTAQRTKAAAREELQRSLGRMGVDHVDLWQLHNLVDPIEWDVALSQGGALEAALEAREEGLVRFIGVTGHGAQVAATHRRSLERFDFDSVLLPYNFTMMQSDYYATNFEAVVATCASRGTAVQTIKAIATAPWAGRPHTYNTWYEPLDQPGDIDLAVWWALARPGVFLNSTADTRLLPLVLDAASRFFELGQKRPSDQQMQDLVARREVVPLFV